MNCYFSNRLVSSLLLVSFCFSPMGLRANGMQTSEVKKEFYSQLSPYFIDTKQQAKPVTSIATGTPATQKPHVVDVTLRTLSPNETAQMTLDVLTHVAPKASVAETDINPLEKFDIKQPGKLDVAGKLMPHSSIWGQMAFAEDCTRVFSCDELNWRKNITRFFVDNKNLRTQAQKACELIQSGHRAYLAYFEQVDDTTRQVLESLYFSNMMLAPLNTNKTALAVAETGRWVQMSFLPALWSGLGANLIAKTTQAGLKTFTAYTNPDLTRWTKVKNALSDFGRIPDKTITDTAKNFGYGHYPVASKKVCDLAAQIRPNEQAMFQEMYPWLPEAMRDQVTKGYSADDKDRLSRNIARMRLDAELPSPSIQDKYEIGRDAMFGLGKGAPVVAALMSYGMQIGFDALLFFALKKAAADITQTNSIYNNYQTRLIGISKIVRGLTMLSDIARQVNSAELQSITQDIELFLDASANKDLASLLDALKTNTFRGDTSFFSNRPRILATNKLMERCKDLFVRPLLAAGKLETFVAAADYYAKHQDTNKSGAGKPVCFVDFVDDAEPRLELENVWNILIDEEKAVCVEDIKFGKFGAQNAIFNGPNGTGKSTNENAIAHTIFMSKFGIACASHAVMTPFEIFQVHRNEQEDIGKGNSSFMAQKARFDEICAHIASLTDKRMIIFMDEPLNGTVEEEAGRIIYEQCEKLLAHQKQAICIIATHAKQPTLLEAGSNGTFVNYYVEVLEPAAGEFVRTYRLVRGLADWWFDDADKRHRFVEWLSRETTAAHAASNGPEVMIKK